MMRYASFCRLIRYSPLFVKRRRNLTDALSITPSYLRNDFSASGLVTDYRDWQIPLGRRFRALKIWFVMRTYGVSGLKAHIRNHIKLGEMFHSLIVSRNDLFDVLTPPAFALTVFTILPRTQSHHEALKNGVSEVGVTDGLVNGSAALHPGDKQLDEANLLTKTVYELVNSRGEIFITSSVVNGVYAIRVVSANPMAEEKYIRRAFDILVRTTEEVLTSRKGEKREEVNGQ